MKTLMWRITAFLLLIVGAVSSNPGAGAEGAPTVPTIQNSICDTDGEIANGQKNGGDDTIFIGKLYGKGKYTWPDGDVYDGEWLFFMPHGVGKIKNKYGSGYDGEWFAAEPHGTGTLTRLWQLYRYQGGFSYNKKHGKGVEAWFWNFIEFEVEFEDGQLVNRSLRFASLLKLIVRVIILDYLLRHYPGLVLLYLYFWIGRM